MSGLEQTISDGYQQTEVGVIPEDWKSDQLGDYVEICSGESPSKFAFKLKGVPYFKVEQLNNHPFYADLTPYFIDTKKVISGGSVIFPKRGASILSNKIRVLKRDSFMDTNLMTLTCNADLDSKYLYNQLTYRGLDSVADTTSIPQINNKHIYPFYIPIPVIEEQTAIANALSDVDALLSELENLIAKKQAIKTATMQQLLTGKTRLPQFATYTDGDKQGQTRGTKPSELGEIPEDWDVKALSSMLNATPSYGINAAAVPLVGNLPVYIRITDISEDGCFKPSKRVGVNSPLSDLYKLQIGDLVLARTGASVGKSYLYRESDGELVFAGFLIRVSPNEKKLISEYLSHYLKTDKYWAWVTVNSMRSGQPGINGNEFGSLPLPIPSTEEQTAIATILSDMDEEIQALKQRLFKTRQIKQGMMQELLTGKTRLPFDKVDTKSQGEPDAN